MSKNAISPAFIRNIIIIFSVIHSAMHMRATR